MRNYTIDDCRISLKECRTKTQYLELAKSMGIYTLGKTSRDELRLRIEKELNDPNDETASSCRIEEDGQKFVCGREWCRVCRPRTWYEYREDWGIENEKKSYQVVRSDKELNIIWRCHIDNHVQIQISKNKKNRTTGLYVHRCMFCAGNAPWEIKCKEPCEVCDRNMLSLPNHWEWADERNIRQCTKESKTEYKVKCVVCGDVSILRASAIERGDRCTKKH